ncbi:MAG: DNA topoisomerase 4 subunit A [Clostridia bacterium]|nr:DNA topoisomerase 4 subunit A [Clostridia bacterium]
MSDDEERLDSTYNNDEEKQDLQPIDGQIGIEELYVREPEEVEDTQEYVEPIDGQFTFDDVLGSNTYQNDFLGKDTNFNYQDGGELVLPTTHLENLNDFFKDPNEKTSNKQNDDENENLQQIENETDVENEEHSLSEYENENNFESEDGEFEKLENENIDENKNIENENINDDENDSTQKLSDDEGLSNFFKGYDNKNTTKDYFSNFEKDDDENEIESEEDAETAIVSQEKLPEIDNTGLDEEVIENDDKLNLDGNFDVKQDEKNVENAFEPENETFFEDENSTEISSEYEENLEQTEDDSVEEDVGETEEDEVDDQLDEETENNYNELENNDIDSKENFEEENFNTDREEVEETYDEEEIEETDGTEDFSESEENEEDNGDSEEDDAFNEFLDSSFDEDDSKAEKTEEDNNFLKQDNLKYESNFDDEDKKESLSSLTLNNEDSTEGPDEDLNEPEDEETQTEETEEDEFDDLYNESNSGFKIKSSYYNKNTLTSSVFDSNKHQANEDGSYNDNEELNKESTDEEESEEETFNEESTDEESNLYGSGMEGEDLNQTEQQNNGYNKEDNSFEKIEEDETYNNFYEEGENKLGKDDVKDKKKLTDEKSTKPKKEKDVNFFENEENSKTIKDVENLNKDYKEMNMEVGHDVFEGVSSRVETSAVNEREVNIQEKVVNENSGQDVVDGMLYKNLDTVLHESMIPYSEHVILDRALPRVEDGLKPVQRRILYSMLELGVTPDKPYRKSARIVGDCLGKYHPHGDSSVYQAMVRMAQPFNTNVLLVNGHGNFGSVDGDGAAAMRYTEARLAPLAMELLRDLDKNTVRWALNFDDTLKEPEILPGRFPNLLVNGSTGIAVGLATNIPPHNLAEVIDGVIAYINSPSISLKEMLKIIKGPDFPTGAYILNNSELKQAYETGRGKIYLRAKMHIESNGTDKKYIVITEFPYQVNKSSLLQKIATFRDENKYNLGDISEIRDESDREGIRAVIRVKKDGDIKAIYESLLKNTELQTTFGINMVAIANGKPRQMGLLDIISYYAEYQREVILRRSKYELEQAKEREHILAGLIIAIKNIDAVVKIIKTSQNTTEAKKRLREKFVLSEKQAQAILDMRLARLTSLEVYKLEEELKRLRELIKKLTAIINSKKLQFQIVKDELSQIKRQYKTERKTRMMKVDETLQMAAEPKVPESQNVIILKSAYNYFKCVNMRQYNYAQKEVNDNSTLFDTHTIKFETETNRTLLAFSNHGNCFKIDVSDFSESRYRDKGVPEEKMFKELDKGETIVALFDFEDTKTKQNLMFLTKFGMIKKTEFTEYALLKKYFQGMKLKEGDEIISIVKEPVTPYTVVLVSKTGMVLNADSGDIPLQGRISGGVKGINLATNDYCVGINLAGDGGEVVCVTNKGYAKRVLLANIDKMARYRKGLKFMTFAKDNGSELVYASVVTNPQTVMCVGETDDELYYRSTDLIPIEARIGKGKPVDKTKKNMSVKKAFTVNN